MKNLMSKIKNVVMPIGVACAILIGCASTHPTSYNILNEGEIKITLDNLKKIEPKYKKLEKELYELLSQNKTDTEYFQNLQTKYHLLKAEKEKYLNILKLNQKK